MCFLYFLLFSYQITKHIFLVFFLFSLFFITKNGFQKQESNNPKKIFSNQKIRTSVWFLEIENKVFFENKVLFVICFYVAGFKN